ncbi:FkbM family methyltransferase [Luteibacter sp. SG786]|uniref:FkbM family methyltransferase n=1 Tax=Luteibacter sp. SG786 TaxID=2587130 RepID=UPI00141DE50A|nr:FkbM family methyltransferase [Luteibacter sp. SG786]NII53149.1 FkbM family methyltransferase [Luteibacter sp. SG786]
MIFPRFVDDALKRLLERKGYFRLKGKNGFELERRRKLLASLDADLLLDVGANVGQYAREMRRLGYHGPIVSFEPMRSALSELEPAATADGNWKVVPAGVSDRSGTTQLHIAKNSISSSVLDMERLHSAVAPASEYIASEEIVLTTLDQAMTAIATDARRIWLKIDVQGLEDRVLAGATETLHRVACIQLELSLAPLYKGQTTYLPMLLRLAELGFDLAGVEAGFLDAGSGRLLQMDGLLVRREP